MTSNEYKSHQLTMGMIKKFKAQVEIISLLNEDNNDLAALDEFKMYTATYRSALQIMNNLYPVEWKGVANSNSFFIISLN